MSLELVHPFAQKNRVLVVFYLHPFTLIWLAHLYAAKKRTEHYKIAKKNMIKSPSEQLV